MDVAQAILVVGDEKMFLKSAKQFSQFLQTVVRIEKIHLIEADEFTPKQLIEELEKIIKILPPKEPLLLVYEGHGGKKGWYYNKTTYLPYAWLADTLCNCLSPIIFINACCYSMSVKKFLQGKIPEERISLITIALENRVGYDGLLQVLMNIWGKSTYFEPLSKIHETYKVANLNGGVIGGTRAIWKHRLSKFLNNFLPYRPITPLYFINPIPGVPEEDDEEKPFYSEGYRWGAKLDHYFFPKNLQLSLFDYQKPTA